MKKINFNTTQFSSGVRTVRPVKSSSRASLQSSSMGHLSKSVMEILEVEVEDEVKVEVYK